MQKYTQKQLEAMSNAEIDAAIAERFGLKWSAYTVFPNPAPVFPQSYDRIQVKKKYGAYAVTQDFSPTERIQDGIPIAHKYGISSIYIDGKFKYAELNLGQSNIQSINHRTYDENPLRAAMIVFLLLEEGE